MLSLLTCFAHRFCGLLGCYSGKSVACLLPGASDWRLSASPPRNNFVLGIAEQAAALAAAASNVQQQLHALELKRRRTLSPRPLAAHASATSVHDAPEPSPAAARPPEQPPMAALPPHHIAVERVSSSVPMAVAKAAPAAPTNAVKVGIVSPSPTFALLDTLAALRSGVHRIGTLNAVDANGIDAAQLAHAVEHMQRQALARPHTHMRTPQSRSKLQASTAPAAAQPPRVAYAQADFVPPPPAAALRAPTRARTPTALHAGAPPTTSRAALRPCDPDPRGKPPAFDAVTAPLDAFAPQQAAHQARRARDLCHGGAGAPLCPKPATAPGGPKPLLSTRLRKGPQCDGHGAGAKGPGAAESGALVMAEALHVRAQTASLPPKAQAVGQTDS